MMAFARHDPRVPLATVAEPVVVDTQQQLLETKATSLRRASAALLFFGVACVRPWNFFHPLLSIFVAFSVLCATSSRLVYRARRVRCLSMVTALFAGASLVCLFYAVSTKMPQRFANATQTECLKMPADTFKWGKDILLTHSHHGALYTQSSVNHTFDADRSTSTIEIDGTGASTSTFSRFISFSPPGHRILRFLAGADQEAACGKIARMVKCFGSMMIFGSALAELGLLLAAIAVAKRACRLKRACASCSPTAAVVVAGPPPAAKELA